MPTSTLVILIYFPITEQSFLDLIKSFCWLFTSITVLLNLLLLQIHLSWHHQCHIVLAVTQFLVMPGTKIVLVSIMEKKHGICIPNRKKIFGNRWNFVFQWSFLFSQSWPCHWMTMKFKSTNFKATNGRRFTHWLSTLNEWPVLTGHLTVIGLRHVVL